MEQEKYVLKHFHNGKLGVSQGSVFYSTLGPVDGTVLAELPWDSNYYQMGDVVRMERVVRNGNKLIQVDEKGNSTCYTQSSYIGGLITGLLVIPVIGILISVLA
ncbi:MAG: hypothetical protein JKY50_00590 [Oleispira sp.]|nr:hypothetical protein [Oleispira sp.]